MVDASVVVSAVFAGRGLEHLPRDVIAPPLLWSEARSAIRLAGWRGQLSAAGADTAHERLLTVPIQRRDPPELGLEAWEVAREMGWARTYDAEYVALARLAGCRLLTEDQRLRRGADRLGIVIVPEEL